MDRWIRLAMSSLLKEQGSKSCSWSTIAAIGASIKTLGWNIHVLYCEFTSTKWMVIYMGSSWLLQKDVHFIPLRDGKLIQPDILWIFLESLWRHHGIQSTITSDGNIRFTSTIWKGIVDTPGIKSQMLSPFHPQTDGQTEKVNQTLECYLWNYCHYKNDNWEQMLTIAEYAYKNSLCSTAKIILSNLRLSPSDNLANGRTLA